MKKWVMKVSQSHRMPFWMGNIEAESRAQAKVEARRMLLRHLEDGKIVCIAEGRIDVSITGEEFPVD